MYFVLYLKYIIINNLCQWGISMKIHKNFVGGNIKVIEINGSDVYLENEIRDTVEDWFYWAFCVEGANGKTITFNMQKTRIGHFGPAVSYDLVNWHWLNQLDGNSFTYTFAENESCVYFAHSMLYHPQRFLNFANERNLEVQELCKSRKGRSVPCVRLGEGEKQIIVTARHHCCESTGTFVMQGFIEEMLESLPKDFSVLCVPFADYDGVVEGDQGKSRAPHDYNRDYFQDINEVLYPETRAIIDFANKNGCNYGFDLHSPWHQGGENGEHDTVFILHNDPRKADKFVRFGKIFEQSISDKSFKYFAKNDIPFGCSWNKGGGTQFSKYMTKRTENELAFTLETTYFGTKDNVVTDEKLVELGRCFAKAVLKYDSLI